MKTLALKIEDISESILDRAENRVDEAIRTAKVSFSERNDEIEISSFPVAIMIVAATGNLELKRRYALAESKRVSALLEHEDKDKLFKIVEIFNWEIKSIKYEIDARNYTFGLHFVDYLRNTKGFHEKEWKLVNRIIVGGKVYLSKHEVARLFEEEVRKYIEKRLNLKMRLMLPQNVEERIEHLRRSFTNHSERVQSLKIPQDIVISSFPPCMKELHAQTASGQHISHVGRFALTSFLINIGMTVENLLKLFRSYSDFDQKMTSYQVEHIAGIKGSRTKYVPPKCKTLKTHGFCPETDDTCKRIRHPLSYYRRKLGVK